MSNSVKYVDHTYRDFSRYVVEGGELIKHKKSGNNFPARLHKILSGAAHFNIITWMPHGRAWRIVDKDRLVSEVIPRFYVCKKYESFTRQLNGWGFKRLHQHGPDFGCYYHECFLRDIPEITCLIRRLQPNLGKATPFAEGEPNFYKIGELYPLPPSPRPALQTQDCRAERAPGAESSRASAALSLACADIASGAIPNGIAHKIHQTSSFTNMATVQSNSGLLRKVSAQEALVAVSSQTGSYYHQPSNHSNLVQPHLSQNSGHYCGNSNDHYPTQSQQYTQPPYYHAAPALFHNHPPPALARNEDRKSNNSHASHLNENGLCHYFPALQHKVSSQSQPDGKRPSEKSSEQDTGTDPFEPIQLSWP